MSGDKQLRRELVLALVGIVAAVIVTGVGVIMLAHAGKPHAPRQQYPKVSEMDALFEEHFELVDRAMDILWRHHEVFDDLMMMEDRTTSCTVGGSGWDIRGVNYRVYMTEAEWQTVLEMYDTLDPYYMSYSPAMGPHNKWNRCRCWTINIVFRAADDERAWKEGWTQVVYGYARCTEEDHEGFDPACVELRSALNKWNFRIVDDQYGPMGPDWWYRGAQFKEWK